MVKGQRTDNPQSYLTAKTIAAAENNNFIETVGAPPKNLLSPILTQIFFLYLLFPSLRLDLSPPIQLCGYSLPSRYCSFQIPTQPIPGNCEAGKTAITPR
ncbi:hypothetical protein Ddc_04835 [Ditylenchus destructor]|nr:hypothetical protein Ddc_04835 [Ditylenchus destructor]